MPVETQINGGTARVRTGSNANYPVRFISNELSLSEIGTFHQLELNAAAGGSENAFSIYEFDGEQTSYAKFEMFIDNNSATYEFLLGSGGSFGANTGQIGNTFTGIEFSVDESGEITARRRISNGFSTSTDIDIFESNTKYSIEIFANNSTSSQKYHYNGVEFSLNEANWSIWVNGELKLNNRTSGALDNGLNLDGFMFIAKNSPESGGTMYIDNIVYSNSLPDILTIEGGEGWRMLATPMDGVTVGQLSLQNLVQGISGSEYPSPDFLPNIFTSHPGQNDPEGL